MKLLMQVSKLLLVIEAIKYLEMELTMQVSKPVTLEIKEMMEVSISVELHVIINIMHIILIIHIEVTSGDQGKRRSRNETFNASIEVTSGDRITNEAIEYLERDRIANGSVETSEVTLEKYPELVRKEREMFKKIV